MTTTRTSRKTRDPSYERKLDRSRRVSRESSEAGRDIGDIPPVKNPARRAEAEASFRRFCEIYFPNTFDLEWSDDHIRLLECFQRIFIFIRSLAFALARGTGKSAITRAALIYVLITGKHIYCYLIANTGDAAVKMLENIRTELETNDLLLEDFPEVCYPIRCLDGEARRCGGQRHHGLPTRIKWSSTTLVLPTIPGSPASEARLEVVGLDGNIRGATYTRACDGRTVRPTFAVLDDPQTDESARSPTQTANRLSIINKTVANLAGPGKSLSIIMPCTVIEEDDLADQVLKLPRFAGIRTKFVRSWPQNEELWEKYHAIRRTDQDADLEDFNARATAFYRKHREEMDEGADMAWPVRFDTEVGEISAVQHAQNLRADIGEEAFAAEYQNEPYRAQAESAAVVTTADILKKLNGVQPGLVHDAATVLTAFIDVHDNLLYWRVMAFSQGFSGWTVDYGTEPEQSGRRFTLRQAKRTLGRVYQGLGREGAIRAGLDSLADRILGRPWIREGGGELRVRLCLVDAGYERDVVHDFCRHSIHAAVLMPSRGVAIGPGDKPIAEYQRFKGDQLGQDWYIPSSAKARTARYVRFDANRWKTFVRDRYATGLGSPGSFSLGGHDPERHRLIAEHDTAEVPTRVTAKGMTMDTHKMPPGVTENHWGDGVVGCAVAASMLGVELAGRSIQNQARRRRRRRMKASA